MKFPDNSALGTLFGLVQNGHTLYGAFAYMADRGLLNISKSTLRGQVFAEKNIKKFSDIAALLDETFGSDEFAQWILNDQTFRPCSLEGSVVRKMKDLTIAAGVEITSEVMEEIHQKKN